MFKSLRLRPCDRKHFSGSSALRDAAGIGKSKPIPMTDDDERLTAFFPHRGSKLIKFPPPLPSPRGGGPKVCARSQGMGCVRPSFCACLLKRAPGPGPGLGGPGPLPAELRLRWYSLCRCPEFTAQVLVWHGPRGHRGANRARKGKVI